MYDIVLADITIYYNYSLHDVSMMCCIDFSIHELLISWYGSITVRRDRHSQPSGVKTFKRHPCLGGFWSGGRPSAHETLVFHCFSLLFIVFLCFSLFFNVFLSGFFEECDVDKNDGTLMFFPIFHETEFGWARSIPTLDSAEYHSLLLGHQCQEGNHLTNTNQHWPSLAMHRHPSIVGDLQKTDKSMLTVLVGFYILHTTKKGAETSLSHPFAT